MSFCDVIFSFSFCLIDSFLILFVLLKKSVETGKEREMEKCPVCGRGPQEPSIVLERYVQENIVLARAMGVRVCCVGDDGHVVLTAPLACNSNDKGTGFAGSLSSLAMLACWACAARVAERLCGTDTEHTVVARDASVRFRRPVRRDFVAVAQGSTHDVLAHAAEEYAARGRAHLTLHADVFESASEGAGAEEVAATPCLSCDGTYVVLAPADAGATRTPTASLAGL